MDRTSLQLYRDCLRLVAHIAPGISPKAQALKATVRDSFRANAGLKEPKQVEAAKAGAVRALANYMLYESAGSEKSGGLKEAMTTFTEKERPAK